MHSTNVNWWIYASGRWAKHFNGAKVLEVGSYIINGSTRGLFGDVESYVGVDWRAGPGVDVVSLAHEMGLKFPKASFDVIVSASMLEHDPYWKLSLGCMDWLLKPDGLLLLTWGAAENGEHEAKTAPDGEFHARPVHDVFTVLSELKFFIQEFRYEENMPFNAHLMQGLKVPHGSRKVRGKDKKWKERKKAVAQGCVCLAAVKSEELIEQPVWIDSLHEGDAAPPVKEANENPVSENSEGQHERA